MCSAPRAAAARASVSRHAVSLLSGQSVDQVEGQAGEQPPRRRLRRPDRLRRAVVAAEEGEARRHRRPARPATGAESPRRRRRESALPRHPSGLASSETSTGPSPGQSARARAMSRPAASGRIKEGVPPPKKMETRVRGPIIADLGPHVRRDGAHQRRLLVRASARPHHVEIAVGANARAVGPVDVEAEVSGP